MKIKFLFLIFLIFAILLAYTLSHHPSHSDNHKTSVQNCTIINLGRISDATLLMIDNAVWSGEQVYIATAYAIKHERIYSPVFGCNERCEKILELNPARQSRAIVWVDDEILIFGGSVKVGNDYNPTDEIVSVNPKTGKVEVLETKLPYPTHEVAAVRADGSVYVFLQKDDESDPELWRFDLENESMKKVDVRFPEGLKIPIYFSRSVVWDGSSIYVIYKNRIARFDPSNSTFEWLNATLPTKEVKAWSRAAVMTDAGIFIIGGCDSYTNCTDEIFLFNPDDGGIHIMKSRLPTPRGGCAAVWDGNSIYIIGGWEFDKPLNELLRYDYKNDRCSDLS